MEVEVMSSIDPKLIDAKVREFILSMNDHGCKTSFSVPFKMVDGWKPTEIYVTLEERFVE